MEYLPTFFRDLRWRGGVLAGGEKWKMQTPFLYGMKYFPMGGIHSSSTRFCVSVLLLGDLPNIILGSSLRRFSCPSQHARDRLHLGCSFLILQTL